MGHWTQQTYQAFSSQTGPQFFCRIISDLNAIKTSSIKKNHLALGVWGLYSSFVGPLGLGKWGMLNDLSILKSRTQAPVFMKMTFFSRMISWIQYKNMLMAHLTQKDLSSLKGYLPLQNYSLIQSSPWCAINEFFHLNKKCFVLEIMWFLCFWGICRFQNLWRHHRHCWIMEVTLMLISFNPMYYQNEIWSSTSVLYDKHF